MVTVKRSPAEDAVVLACMPRWLSGPMAIHGTPRTTIATHGDVCANTSCRKCVRSRNFRGDVFRCVVSVGLVSWSGGEGRVACGVIRTVARPPSLSAHHTLYPTHPGTHSPAHDACLSRHTTSLCLSYASVSLTLSVVFMRTMLPDTRSTYPSFALPLSRSFAHRRSRASAVVYPLSLLVLTYRRSLVTCSRLFGELPECSRQVSFWPEKLFWVQRGGNLAQLGVRFVSLSPRG